jgi:hypothetical protein
MSKEYKGLGNPNIAEVGKATRFSSTNQPKNRGRKASLLKHYIQKVDLGIDDQIIIFENIVCTHTANELKEMVTTGKDPLTGKEVPGLVWGFIIAWLSDSKKGWNFGGINKTMQDRKHGKVTEKIKIETPANFGVDRLTPEERKAEIKRLLEKKAKKGEEETNGKDIRETES